MPLYIKHHSSFQESINTTVIVKNINDIRNIIYEDWRMWEGNFRKNDNFPFGKYSFSIKIENYTWEIKTGWYFQIVSADLQEKGEFMPVGFLSEPMGN